MSAPTEPELTAEERHTDAALNDTDGTCLDMHAAIVAELRAFKREVRGNSQAAPDSSPAAGETEVETVWLRPESGYWWTVMAGLDGAVPFVRRALYEEAVAKQRTDEDAIRSLGRSVDAERERRIKAEAERDALQMSPGSIVVPRAELEAIASSLASEITQSALIRGLRAHLSALLGVGRKR